MAKKIGIPNSSKLRKDELERIIKHYLETGKIKASNRKNLLKKGVRDYEKGLSLAIEAKFYKEDNNIPDEVNEIEQEMAEMELAQEKHVKKLPANPTESVQDLTEHHIIEPAKEEPPQLSLF